MLNTARPVFLLATAAFAVSPSATRAQACDDLILGAALSVTGIYASNGLNTKNGYEYSVKKVNDAGGVKIGGKCYHFKINYYDDEFDTRPGRAAGRAAD